MGAFLLSSSLFGMELPLDYTLPGVLERARIIKCTTLSAENSSLGYLLLCEYSSIDAAMGVHKELNGHDYEYRENREIHLLNSSFMQKWIASLLHKKKFYDNEKFFEAFSQIVPLTLLRCDFEESPKIESLKNRCLKYISSNSSIFKPYFPQGLQCDLGKSELKMKGKFSFHVPVPLQKCEVPQELFGHYLGSSLKNVEYLMMHNPDQLKIVLQNNAFQIADGMSRKDFTVLVLLLMSHGLLSLQDYELICDSIIEQNVNTLEQGSLVRALAELGLQYVAKKYHAIKKCITQFNNAGIYFTAEFFNNCPGIIKILADLKRLKPLHFIEPSGHPDLDRLFALVMRKKGAAGRIENFIYRLKGDNDAMFILCDDELLINYCHFYIATEVFGKRISESKESNKCLIS